MRRHLSRQSGVCRCSSALQALQPGWCAHARAPLLGRSWSATAGAAAQPHLGAAPRRLPPRRTQSASAGSAQATSPASQRRSVVHASASTGLAWPPSQVILGSVHQAAERTGSAQAACCVPQRLCAGGGQAAARAGTSSCEPARRQCKLSSPGCAGHCCQPAQLHWLQVACWQPPSPAPRPP